MSTIIIMKKILLSIAVVVALGVTAVSCGHKSEADTTATMKSKIENCTNPDSLKAYVDQARAYADRLVAEGKVDEAKKYLAAIEPVVKEKAPALAGALSTVENALDKVGDAAADKAADAKASATAAVDSAKAAAGSAADAVKEKASDVADAAKDKFNAAKEATADAAKDGADKVKDLLK